MSALTKQTCRIYEKSCATAWSKHSCHGARRTRCGLSNLFRPTSPVVHVHTKRTMSSPCWNFFESSERRVQKTQPSGPSSKRNAMAAMGMPGSCLPTAIEILPRAQASTEPRLQLYVKRRLHGRGTHLQEVDELFSSSFHCLPWNRWPNMAQVTGTDRLGTVEGFAFGFVLASGNLVHRLLLRSRSPRCTMSLRVLELEAFPGRWRVVGFRMPTADILVGASCFLSLWPHL